ncbi:MAG: hypothetical protein AUG84_01545 [Chloroflexi bacterium 13_1_20CM_4_66_7]|nr:MAG: hypothetical protein AUG84_01545 [Chloroflexi bacterium 13_1_20CM_4_66_7]
MIARYVLGVSLAVVMLVFGTTTYVFLGTRASHVAEIPQKPTVATPRAQAFSMSGTLYIIQNGALYSLSAGRFHQLTPEAGWTMPSMLPNGTGLVAVRRFATYSDVYTLNRFGQTTKRLTSNVAPARNTDIGANHWSFYPRVSADGKTLWMSYDQPKYGYDVVMSVWALPMGAPIRQGKLWTNAADYSGGDVQPIPVRTGMIYTKYSYGPDDKLVGQLWFTNRAYSAGRALTTPGEDCRSPAVSPSGTQIAMICTYEKQISYLMIASWNGTTLGVRKGIITNQLVAQPTWAPDDSGIAYLAPGAPAGPFQLWFLPKAAYAPAPTPSPSPGASPVASPSPVAPVKPVQVTTNNGFDATSPLAWSS